MCIYSDFAARPATNLTVPRKPPETEELYVGAKYIATVLDVSERTAQRLLQTGEIRAFKVGRLLKTQPSEISRYVARQVATFKRAA